MNVNVNVNVFVDISKGVLLMAASAQDSLGIDQCEKLETSLYSIVASCTVEVDDTHNSLLLLRSSAPP